MIPPFHAPRLGRKLLRRQFHVIGVELADYGHQAGFGRQAGHGCRNGRTLRAASFFRDGLVDGGDHAFSFLDAV